MRPPRVPADLGPYIERAVREELFSEFRFYCQTSATGRAKRLLLSRPQLLFRTGGWGARVLGDVSRLGARAIRLAEYRLALLEYSRRVGVEQAFRDSVLPVAAGGPSTESEANDKIRQLLSQLTSLNALEDIVSFLGDHPFLVAEWWEREFASKAARSREEGRTDAALHWDFLSYLVRRCFSTGLEAGSIQAIIVDHIRADPRAMAELDLNDDVALMSLMDVVGDFSDPEVTHTEQVTLVADHPELLSDDAIQLVEAINAYSETMPAVRRFAALAHSTLMMARETGVPLAMMSLRLSEILTEPDEAASDSLAHAFIGYFGDDLRPDLVDLSQLSPEEATRAEHRLRRLSRNAEHESRELRSRISEFCFERSWDAVSTMLTRYPLLRSPVARVYLRRWIEAWLDGGPPPEEDARALNSQIVNPDEIAALGIERLRLLAEVDEFGIETALAEAGKRMSRWIATKEHGGNLIVVDHDFLDQNALSPEELTSPFAMMMLEAANSALAGFLETNDVSALSGGIWATDRAKDALSTSPSVEQTGLQLEISNTRAALLRLRASVEGSVEDLDEAVALLDEARTLSASGHDRFQLAANLVDALLQRYSYDHAEHSLVRAKSVIEEERLAHEEGKSPNDRARGLYMLGRVLFTEVSFGPSAAQLDECVATFEAAAAGHQHLAVDLQEGVLSGLANALMARFHYSHAPADLSRAIETYRRACALDPEGEREREYSLTPSNPEARVNLAAALLEQASLSQTSLKDSAIALESAIEAAEYAPTVRSAAAKRLGEIKMLQGDWSGAARALRQSLTAIESIVGSQVLSTPGQGSTAELSSLSASAAYAHAQAGLPLQAAQILERFKAIGFTQSLLRDLGSASQMHSAGDFGPGAKAGMELEFLDAVPPHPVVYIVGAEEGGLAVVLTPDGERIESDAISLPALRSDELLQRTEAFLAAIKVPSLTAQLQVEDITRWLWTSVMSPVVEYLEGWEVAVLVPCGLLNLLPLHAAWTPDTSQRTGRRYAIDHLQLSYVLNLRSYLMALRCADKPAREGVLVVDEPLPVTAAPLIESPAEAAAAFLGPPPHIHLRHERATTKAILSSIRSVGTAHFSCHGESDLVNPLKSYLLCADDERLTLAEMMREDLTGLRLAVLSACESGSVGGPMIDEVMGFFGALQRAGVLGVVASTWKVPSASTAEAMMRFYDGVFEQHVDPPAALRQALCGVRDSTGSEKREYLSARLGHETRLYPLVPDQALPHARPYQWAGFSYFGA